MSRELKNTNLKLLAWVILILVINVYSTSFISTSINKSLIEKTSELIGADKVLYSNFPLDKNLFALAHNNQLKTAKKVEFNGMVVSNSKANYALSAIKAVSTNYPLKGKLKVANKIFKDSYDTNDIPRVGEVWLEPRLMLLLDVNIGEVIELGSKKFTVTKIITYEPDKIGIYAFAPRALMNYQDLESTKILQPGSRAQYSMQILGKTGDIKNFEATIPTNLKQSINIDDVESMRPAVKRALDRGSNFLGLFTVVNILLAGIAVAVCSRSYSLGEVKKVAVMRTFGASKTQLLCFYGTQLLSLTLIMTIIGIIIGIILQVVYLKLLNKFLPEISFMVHMLPILIATTAAITLTICFAMPRILQLCEVSPMAILQRKLILPNATSKIAYITGAGILLLFILWIVRDLKLLQIFGVLLFGVGGTFALILDVMLNQIKKYKSKFSFYIRLGLNALFYDKIGSLVQILSVAMILTVALVLYYVKTDLLNTWQSQLPDNTHNFFVINITSDVVTDFNKFINDNNIDSSDLYPILRGRLIKINGEPVSFGTSSSNLRKGLHRELNLTWDNDYPKGNILIAGNWFTDDNQAQHNFNTKQNNIFKSNKSNSKDNKEISKQISIEKNLVNQLDVKLGDTLTFVVGAEQITATITSIREADWDSFRPNFYAIYPEGTINHLPHSFMSSFYLPNDKLAIANQMITNFPAVSIIDTSVVLNQVKDVINTIVNIISLLWGFTIIVGIILFYAVVLITVAQRVREYKIMQLIGASKKFIAKLFVVENILLGLMITALAMLIANLIAYYISVSIFKLSYTINYNFVFIGFILIFASIFICSSFALKTYRKKY